MAGSWLRVTCGNLGSKYPKDSVPQNAAPGWKTRGLGVAQQGVDGDLSTQGAGWKVLFASSGNLSGWRIDSIDKSISKSGQNR